MNNIKISNHALERFKERVVGIPNDLDKKIIFKEWELKNFEEQLFDEMTRNSINILGNGKYPITFSQDVYAVIKDGLIVTFIKKENNK